jgi:hypothetical protein
LIAFTAQTAVGGPTLRNARAAASTVLDAALGKAPANQAPHFAKLAATMQKGSAPLLFKIYRLAVHA